jgi:hypothetical protein
MSSISRRRGERRRPQRCSRAVATISNRRLRRPSPGGGGSLRQAVRQPPRAVTATFHQAITPALHQAVAPAFAKRGASLHQAATPATHHALTATSTKPQRQCPVGGGDLRGRGERRGRRPRPPRAVGAISNRRLRRPSPGSGGSLRQAVRQPPPSGNSNLGQTIRPAFAKRWRRPSPSRNASLPPRLNGGLH